MALLDLHILRLPPIEATSLMATGSQAVLRPVSDGRGRDFKAGNLGKGPPCGPVFCGPHRLHVHRRHQLGLHPEERLL